MSGWTVQIPGISVPHESYAEDRDEAVREALDRFGLHFAPEGTTVTPLDDTNGDSR
ncbi:hypothetical protein [Luteimonas saliphila]|uniref:hypothetical protein n=1 Tax=Luteimonas saliphila TaxID=2804919 RepID=UPI00192D3CAB|nr:hypothetical protein [Luteimonas saliphila]